MLNRLKNLGKQQPLPPPEPPRTPRAGEPLVQKLNTPQSIREIYLRRSPEDYDQV